MVVFHSLLTLQEGQDSLTSLSLRDLSYEGRVNLIRERIKDLAFREILYKMLEDEERRPNADALLGEASVMYFGYLLDEINTDLKALAKSDKALPALLSALTLANKNKAVLSFLSLLNLYKSQSQSSQVLAQLMLEREHSEIAMIELLIICLKDAHGQEDFIDLYNLGLSIIGAILNRDTGRNPEMRM